jgi:peptidoglycan/xylan/chitin deacetylase (PgdA/CDA1 family)
MGGVRFGLPRILDLLEAYKAPATFFVTGLMATIYPHLLQALKERGHSVGVHGRYHEYLPVHLPTQIQQLAAEKERFERWARIGGANFIFRMNENTVQALVASGYRYFVVSMEHLYSPFTYRKMPVQPFQIWTDRGTIWMVPVSVETYNRPVMAVALAANSAVHQARLEAAPAINVLLHPFRDGSLRHIGALERLLVHLQTRHKLLPTTIDDIVGTLPQNHPSAYIYVVLGEGEMAGYGDLSRNGLSDWQWHNFSRYWQRVGHLYDALKQIGHTPALCLSCPSVSSGAIGAPVFAVYPYLPTVSTDTVSVDFDPLTCSQRGNKLLSVLEHYTSNGRDKIIVFRPGGFSSDLAGMTAAVCPSQGSDLMGIFPEMAVRFAKRLTGYRHIF